MTENADPVVSIVMPAHNEAAVIGHSLRQLLAGAAPGEFDVIVVPNNCSDHTAQVAREFDVRVLETPIPGKINALRMGDEACRTFPRIYLDADVDMTADSVRALVAACGQPGVLACAPVPRLDVQGVSWVARRVHRTHEALIAPRRALAGVGAYVLNEAGHAKVFPMPDDVISDDGWVHGSFEPAERVVVPQANTVVRPAGTVTAHLERRVRVRLGNRQLDQLGRSAPEGQLGMSELVKVVRQREVSPLDVGCYLSVMMMDRLLARTRGRHGLRWGSDGSSRSVPRGSGTS